MALLTLDAVRKEYGAEPLFRDVTFTLEEGEKTGVIGRNGSGKTTLLRIAAGLEHPDAGEVRLAGGRTLGYLPQNPTFPEEATVLDAIFHGGGEALEAVREYEHACRKLEALGGGDSALAERVSLLAQKLEEARAWDLEAEARSILTRLGIEEHDHRVETLSGGQRKRVALARSLLLRPDLLILDEPTNHLDADTIAWLEEWLTRFTGALLLVTHDRYFLDRVTERMIEIESGRVTPYEGNYTRYLELKEAEEARQEAAERTRKSLIRRELAWLRRGAKARTTKQKARVDRARTLMESPEREAEASLELQAASTRLGRKGIELHGVSMSRGGKSLLEGFTHQFQKGDRIGIVGPNGSGKTTLLELIAGRLAPDAGRVERGETVVLGYYDQESRALADELRVIDYVKETAELVPTADGRVITAGQMLERFLFSPAAQYTYVGSLSGGERRRLYLLRLLMEAPNVLLLDEPTNDFDIDTLVALESYLDAFDGCLVVVSHDRYFLDRTVDHLLVLPGDGTVKGHPGGYSDLLERRRAEEQEARAASRASGGARTGPPSAAASTPEPGPGKPNAPEAARGARLTFRERKELDELESRIAHGEARVAEIGEELARTGADFDRAGPLYRELETLNAALAEDLARWEALAERA